MKQCDAVTENGTMLCTSSSVTARESRIETRAWGTCRRKIVRALAVVAQGFAQRAYDSYNPEETFSPVVHKDTLRLFLSVCAAKNLRIYQADVKAAFLQAPLSERIYMRAPPGYSSVNEGGEE